jgi:hypothetical protein
VSKFFGTRFSRYTISGGDNPNFKGTTVSALAELLNDSSQSADDKAQVAAILKFCIERKKILDPQVADWLNELDASCLFEWPDRFALRDITDKDGTVRREVVCVVSPSISGKTPKAQAPAETDEGDDI